MTDYTVSTTGGNAISPGLHYGLVFGFAGLGLQPGFLPTDMPRVQFALGYRLKDLEAGIQEWWETYTLSFGEKSNLRKHIMAGGLLTQEELAKGFDPRKLIGRPTGLLFQKVPKADGTEKSKLLGLSPMKEPPAGVALEELKAGGKVVFERDRPDPAMLARLPAWIQAKVNPQAAVPGPVYPQPAAPAYQQPAPAYAAAYTAQAPAPAAPAPAYSQPAAPAPVPPPAPAAAPAQLVAAPGFDDALPDNW